MLTNILILLAMLFGFIVLIGYIGFAEVHGYRKGYRHALDKRKPYWKPYDSDKC